LDFSGPLQLQGGKKSQSRQQLEEWEAEEGEGASKGFVGGTYKKYS